MSRPGGMGVLSSTSNGDVVDVPSNDHEEEELAGGGGGGREESLRFSVEEVMFKLLVVAQ